VVSLSPDGDSLSFDPFTSEALRRAEERAAALDAKLKLSNKAREKSEKEVAVVEGLRQRLKTAEDTLSDKVAQQIERENAIVTRLETQNRRFTSKPLFLLPFASVFVCFSDTNSLVFLSSRADG
jgi:protoporphyrinogen oxidase